MKKGFTLIETMIALGVLLVGLIGVIKMQLTGAMATTHSNDITIARNIADDMLSKIVERGPDFILGPISGTTNCQRTASVTTDTNISGLDGNLANTVVKNGLTFNVKYNLFLNVRDTHIFGYNCDTTECIAGSECSAINKVTRAAILSIIVSWNDRLSGAVQSVRAETIINYQ